MYPSEAHHPYFSSLTLNPMDFVRKVAFPMSGFATEGMNGQAYQPRLESTSSRARISRYRSGIRTQQP